MTTYSVAGIELGKKKSSAVVCEEEGAGGPERLIQSRPRTPGPVSTTWMLACYLFVYTSSWQEGTLGIKWAESQATPMNLQLWMEGSSASAPNGVCLYDCAEGPSPSVQS